MEQKPITLKELKEAERESRKQLILTATLNLFGKKQISEVSIRDIAKEAGISPALIYRHFHDRDELFLEAFLLKSEEMITAFDSIISKRRNVSIEEIGKEFIHFLLNNPLFFKMMSYFMLDYSLREEHLDKFNTTIRELLAIFDKGFEENGLKENIRLHSHAFFSSLNGVMITFYNYPGRSEEEIRNHIERLASLIGKLFVQATK
ncbi:TetR/AcrR family transcriptional regulator [Fervidibacillus halotolerans]|uniref:TetR/AcrR family transcriptional regulator n=1 Tax=Fervidibacillus halotolerans TaxID=2980027 RepID=A0A9E8RZJ6_9BACI|nr:TetR/AcrR family transcriptional regulator [Fervidibacillus halotolerans]WAA11702.1 TetR/AcrR family transcriptional regulator [Fervidibacillus halotolerans]